MPKEIKLLKKGCAPSLIEAEQANLLINAVNALRRIKITPQGAGTVQVSDNEVVIDLSSLMNSNTGSSTTQASGNGAATQDQPINNVGGGGSSSSSGGSSDLTARVAALENRLSAATISASCTSTGQITVTLNI